jgi:hypothetical protein
MHHRPSRLRATRATELALTRPPPNLKSGFPAILRKFRNCSFQRKLDNKFQPRPIYAAGRGDWSCCAHHWGRFCPSLRNICRICIPFSPPLRLVRFLLGRNQSLLYVSNLFRSLRDAATLLVSLVDGDLANRRGCGAAVRRLDWLAVLLSSCLAEKHRLEQRCFPISGGRSYWDLLFATCLRLARYYACVAAG